MKFQRYRPFKDPVSASNENAKAAALEGLLNQSGGNGFFAGSGTHHRQPNPGRPWIWARITSNEQEGSDYRWTYVFEEVFKREAGFVAWITKDGGIEGQAYNLAEALNVGAPTYYGNGVRSDDLGEDDELLPVPDGSIVQLWRHLVEDGAEEWWFSFSNALSVVCPEEEEPPP